MKLRPIFILSAAMAHMSAAPMLRAGGPDADSENGAVIFDGAVKRRSDTASFSPAAENKDRLTAELRKQITLDDHGNPDERAVLDSMISRLMDSATAREIAVKFIEEDAKAVVSLEELPDSAVVTVDGKETFWGTLGSVDYTKYPPGVILNKLFMRYDRDPGTGTLAHELLGHAFENQRTRGGALEDDYLYNTDEEVNARLIGWLTRTELDIKPEDAIWAYMQNPEDPTKSFKMLTPYYAQTLTTEEMKNPAPVYASRLAEADKALGQLRNDAKRYGELNEMIDHFVNEHKIDPASFRTIRDDLSNDQAALPSDQERLMEIKAVLQKRLNYFSGDSGKVFLDRLAKESDSEYFKQKDAIIRERQKRLEGLLLGKAPDTSRPPSPAGQITWQQFKELGEKDKESCPFGGMK